MNQSLNKPVDSAINRKQAVLSFLYKGFGSVLGFVNSAIAARFLSKVDRGDFQSSTILQTGGQTFTGGYLSYFGFAIPKRPEDNVRIVQMGNLLVFLLSLLVWLVAVALYFVPIPHLHLSTIWFWALIGMPFTFMFGFGSRILNALNEIPALNRSNLGQALLFFIIYLPTAIICRHRPESFRLFVTYLIWVASWLVNVLTTMWNAYSKLHKAGVLKWKFHREEWTGIANYGSVSAIGQLISYVNYRTDFWMVQYYYPLHFSEYGVAVTAAEVLNTISVSISSLVFARMTGGSREDAIAVTEVASRQTIITSAIAAVGMYIVLPSLLIIAFGHKYAGALLPFYILLPGLIFKATSNVIMQYATNALGDPKVAIRLNLASIILNFVCCAIFLPTTGMAGGAIASTVSYILGFCIAVVWFARKTGTSGRGLWVLQKADFAAYTDLMRAVGRAFKRK